MEKTIHSPDHRKAVAVLRAFRERSGITQVQLAEKLGLTQSFVSKVERGENRLDIIQLRTFCHALGTSLPAFVEALETSLGPRRR